MGVKNSVTAVPLASINANTLGAYQPLNAGGLPQACFMIAIINGSNTDIVVSYNGTTDHDYVQAEHERVIQAQNNAQPNNFVAHFKKGTTVYVKAAGAGVGSINLAGYYQPTAP